MTKDGQKLADSKARTVESLGSESSATVNAESMLESLLWSLRNPNFKLEELPSLIKSYLLSLRLLGMNDEWATWELKGFPNIGEVQDYRKQFCNVEYVAVKSGKVIEEKREICEFDQSVGFLVSQREKDWIFKYSVPDKYLDEKPVTTEKKMTPDQWNTDVVLRQIADELFDRASKTLVIAKYGAAIDTIFRDYQKAVGDALSNLGIEDHLRTAYRNLKGGDEASWRAGALACRNVLMDLSAKLWCVECEDYNMGGELISVKSDKVRNRLRAYMHMKGLDRDDTPVALLDSVYAQASAAKAECSYEDARSVLIVSYLFLAELARQTGMKELKEIQTESGKE